MINEVVSYALVNTPPICAVYGQVDVIREMLSKIDVLIFASGSDGLLQDLPENIEAIELLHEPVQQSVNRLRKFIMPAASPTIGPATPYISPGQGIFREIHAG
jgi:hypothetical protein